jgi:uncharacterized protein YcbX
MISIARINTTPVKGLGLQHPAEVLLTHAGVETDRRFYLRSRGRLYSVKDFGALVAVSPVFAADQLTLSFPSGERVSGPVNLGAAVETIFWGRPVRGRVVEGPWADALTAYTGSPLTLIQTEQPGTGIDIAVGTLVGRASCVRLGAELGTEIDPRCFRMLVELDGLSAHAEDDWTGSRLALGQAIVVVGGPVPRCVVTTQDPDSGQVRFDTLRALRRYRALRDGRYVDFGVYFSVEQPGLVRVGDPVRLL